MSFNRSKILRAAHAYAKRRMLPSYSYRDGDVVDRKLDAYVPKARYREIFAAALRHEWAQAKYAIQHAALVAKQKPVVVTDAEAAEIRSLRYMASIEPLTGSGAAAWRASYALADQIIKAAAARQDAR